MKAFCVCVFVSTAAFAGESEFIELRTPQFTVYSVASERTTRRFVAKVLTFEHVVGRLTGMEVRRAAGPFHIYLVSNEDWSNYFEPRAGTAGLFSDASGLGSDMVVAASSMAAAYPTLFHDYAHFLNRTEFPGYCPPWFDEGIAELLGAARVSEETVRFAAPVGRLRDLGKLSWMPTEALFKVTRDSEEYRQHRLAPSFYAQSWLTMHYAYIASQGFLSQLIDYVVRINRGASEDEAAVEAFGPGGFEMVDHRLRAYAKNPSLQAAALDLRPQEAALSNSPARRLDRTETLIALGQLALRLGVRPERSEPLFAAILADSPQDARALAALAYLSAARDDAPRAREHLGKLASSAALSADAATWAGDAQFRLAQPQLETAQLRLAHGLYQRALAADAEHLGAVHGLARVCMHLDDCLEAAVAALKSAQAQAPASWQIAHVMALLQSRRGDREAALVQWKLLANVAREPELRQLARERLGAK